MLSFLRRRANPACLDAAGRAMRKHIDQSIITATSLYQVSVDEIDLTFRQQAQAQMFAVSLATSMFNYALTDAYYDAGLAGPISGMPTIKFDHADARRALRLAWEGLPHSRLNLDMRYRYILVEGLLSADEQVLWQQMEQWSEEHSERLYRDSKPIDTHWIGFALDNARASVGAADAANENAGSRDEKAQQAPEPIEPSDSSHNPWNELLEKLGCDPIVEPSGPLLLRSIRIDWEHFPKELRGKVTAARCDGPETPPMSFWVSTSGRPVVDLPLQPYDMNDPMSVRVDEQDMRKIGDQLRPYLPPIEPILSNGNRKISIKRRIPSDFKLTQWKKLMQQGAGSD